MPGILTSKKFLYAVIACVLLFALIASSVTFQVRFNEHAVRTVFGQATENSVIKEPGLRLKWPSPIGKVTKYDTRARIKSVKLETQQTRDSRPIVVEAYVVWRVSDPLEFFRAFSDEGERAEDHYKKAEDILETYVRSVLSLVSQYDMSDLFSTKPGGSKLGELEDRMLAALRAGTGEATSQIGDLGIQADIVGVSRIQMVASASAAVFQRMREERASVARQIEAKGQSEQIAIEARAAADAVAIRSFANIRAAEIRRQGDIEAAEFIAMTKDHPEFAIFLRNIEMLREVVPLRANFVLSTSTFGLHLLSPDALSSIEPGEVPGTDLLRNMLSIAGRTPGRSKPANDERSEIEGGGL